MISLVISFLAVSTAAANCGVHGKIKGSNKKVIANPNAQDPCECEEACDSSGALFWSLKYKSARNVCKCFTEAFPNDSSRKLKLKETGNTHRAGKIAPKQCGKTINHNGAVIQRVILKSACECEAACIAKDGCEAWTHVPNSKVWPANTCFFRARCTNDICGFNPNFVEAGQKSGEVEKHCGKHINHNGQVIKRVILESECECEKACTAEDGCEAWTYVPDSNIWPKKTCFFRKRCTNGICGFNPNFVEVGQYSGELELETECGKHLNHNGQVIKRVILESECECEKACEGEKACEAWTYVPDSNIWPKKTCFFRKRCTNGICGFNPNFVEKGQFSGELERAKPTQCCSGKLVDGRVQFDTCCPRGLVSNIAGRLTDAEKARQNAFTGTYEECIAWGKDKYGAGVGYVKFDDASNKCELYYIGACQSGVLTEECPAVDPVPQPTPKPTAQGNQCCSGKLVDGRVKYDTCCPRGLVSSLGRLSDGEKARQNAFTGSYEECIAWGKSTYGKGVGYVKYDNAANKCELYWIGTCPSGQTSAQCPAVDPVPQPTPKPTAARLTLKPTSKTQGNQCCSGKLYDGRVQYDGCCPRGLVSSLGRLSNEEKNRQYEFKGTYEQCIAWGKSKYGVGVGYVKFDDASDKCELFWIGACPSGQTAEQCPNVDPVPEPTSAPTQGNQCCSGKLVDARVEYDTCCPRGLVSGLGRLSTGETARQNSFTGSYEECIAWGKSKYGAGVGYVKYDGAANKCELYWIGSCQSGQTAEQCPAVDPVPQPTAKPTLATARPSAAPQPTPKPTAATPKPSVAATPKPSACNKQAVRKPNMRKLVSVSGAERTHADYWKEQCASIKTENVEFIAMITGNVIDYFKPKAGKTVCEMLTTGQSHQWSSDAENWVTPDGYGNQLGGSTAGWINANREVCDKRVMVNGWGMPYGAGIQTGTTGGHGSNDYSARQSGDVNAWANSFEIWYSVAPCNRQAVNKVGGVKVVDVAGTTLTHKDFWAAECQKIPADAKYISLVMGDVTDYFKPRPGSSFCDLMTIPNKHMWSSNPDANNWVNVDTYGNQLGGSTAQWTSDNAEVCDKRSFLSGWGMPYPAGQKTGTSGGHGSNSYAARWTLVNGWSNPFSVFYHKQ